MVDKDLFYCVINYVFTHCFGTGLNSESFVPMADNLNHSDLQMKTEMINLSLHPEGDKNANYYRISKYMANYSGIFSQGKLFKDARLNVNGRFDKKIYQSNIDAFSVEKVREYLNDHQIWEIPLTFGQHAEQRVDWDENASDQDADFQDEQELESWLNNGLEGVIHQEKKMLAAAQAKKNSGLIKDQLGKKVCEKFENLKIKSDRLNKLVSSQTITEIHQGHLKADELKLDFNEELLDAVEYIPVEQDNEISDRDTFFMDIGMNLEPKEDFKWMDDGKISQDTYFTVINNSRQTLKKGSQAFYHYGKRTNIDLLVNYGFCLKENIYDSVKTRVNLNFEFNFDQNIQPSLPDMMVIKDAEGLQNYGEMDSVGSSVNYKADEPESEFDFSK